jgi:hypothetical protein
MEDTSYGASEGSLNTATGGDRSRGRGELGHLGLREVLARRSTIWRHLGVGSVGAAAALEKSWRCG